MDFRRQATANVGPAVALPPGRQYNCRPNRPGARLGLRREHPLRRHHARRHRPARLAVVGDTLPCQHDSVGLATESLLRTLIESAHITVFQELIAPRRASRRRWNWPDRTLRQQRGRIGELRQPGLSPHAPYSVHPRLLAAVIALSAAERVPVAMHLAESREELELLRHGTGPLRAFWRNWGRGTPRRSRPAAGRWTICGSWPRPTVRW